MTSMIFTGMGCFSAGMILGLLFGPDTERLDDAHLKGWIRGYLAAKNEPQSPSPRGE